MEEKLNKIIEGFKDHVLTTLVDTEDVKIYEYRNPNNSNLWQKWILTQGRLIVVGDAYDAIYYSGAFGSLESIASCNLGYFNSKCVADKDGRNQSTFDSDIAVKSVIQNIRYMHEEGLGEYFEKLISDVTDSDVRKYVDKVLNKAKDSWDEYEIPDYFEHGYQVGEWCSENEFLVGQDWWDGFDTEKLTNTPFWHLGGIKSAVSKIQQNEN